MRKGMSLPHFLFFFLFLLPPCFCSLFRNSHSHSKTQPSSPIVIINSMGEGSGSWRFAMQELRDLSHHNNATIVLPCLDSETQRISPCNSSILAKRKRQKSFLDGDRKTYSFSEVFQLELTRTAGKWPLLVPWEDYFGGKSFQNKTLPNEQIFCLCAGHCDCPEPKSVGLHTIHSEPPYSPPKDRATFSEYFSCSRHKGKMSDSLPLIVLVWRRGFCVQYSPKIQLFSILQLQPHIQEEAKKYIKNFLGNDYITIQWRSETVKTEDLHECYHGLSRLIHRFQQKHQNTSIFFLTDMAEENDLMWKKTNDGLRSDLRSMIMESLRKMGVFLSMDYWSKKRQNLLRMFMDRFIAAHSQQVFQCPPTVPICKKCHRQGQFAAIIAEEWSLVQNKIYPKLSWQDII